MASKISTLGRFTNVTSPSMTLVLWNIILAIPLSYLLASTNKLIFQRLGYKKFMRCEGGSRLNQCIFAFVNIWLVVGWAWQLNEEARVKKEEHIRELKQEIRGWDEEIERLERLFEEKQIQEGLMGLESLVKRESIARSGVSFAGSGSGVRRESRIPVSKSGQEMKIVNGEIVLVENGQIRSPPVHLRRRGRGAASKREHSPISGSQH